MTPEQRAELENLVFSVPSPYLSLDNRLRPFLDLIASVERSTLERAAQECEQEANDAGRVFCEWQDGAYACAARIRALIATEPTERPRSVPDTRPS